MDKNWEKEESKAMKNNVYETFNSKKIMTKILGHTTIENIEESFLKIRKCHDTSQGRKCTNTALYNVELKRKS